MIWWIIPLALLIVTGIAATLKWGCRRDDWTIWLVLTIIASVIVLISSLICTGIVIDEKTDLPKVQKNIVIAQKRFDEMSRTIELYANKYPMEQGLFQKIGFTFLLRLPEIKSNEFLDAQMNKALAQQQEIYKLQMEETQIKKDLEFHKHRWFSPTLASPEYEVDPPR